MNKPLELQNAITAKEAAWDAYDAAVESGADTATKQEFWKVVNWLEDYKSSQYKQWQIFGGKSDIESIALMGVRDTAEQERQAEEIRTDAEWLEDARADMEDYFDLHDTQEAALGR